MTGGSKVQRGGTARTAKEAAARHKRPCRSAPAAVTGFALTFSRKHAHHRTFWNARTSWDALVADVAGRPLTPKRYQVQLRATDASGDPVETHLQVASAKANGASFTVHSGTAPATGFWRELDGSPDVIKKALTGLTTGIAAQVDFYSRKKTSTAVTLKYLIRDTTAGSDVVSKNGSPDSTQDPHVTATLSFTPVSGHSYEARVEYVSGSGVGKLDQIQWHDQGSAAVWTRIVPGDDLAAAFADIPRPKSWYYQARVRAESNHNGAKCWGVWTSWTTATIPATGTPTGPDVPEGITLVLDKVEGTAKRPWRARVGWNEITTWIPEDGDPEDGVARYDIQLAVSNDAGSTTANTRRATVPADPTDTTSHVDFFNVRGKRSYRARVRAFDQLGNPGAWSSWTSWLAPTAPTPAPVTTLTWDNPTPATLRAKWDRPADPTNIDRYHVKVFRGGTLVDEGFTSGSRWDYHIPVADRAATHKVRVSTVEDDMLLDVDAAAPTGYTTPDESATLDSSLIASTDVWTAADIGATAAELTDGSAPASSPAATVEGGPGYLAVHWTAVTNADPVTYEVHVSTTTGFTPGAGTLYAKTGGTQMFVKAMPDASLLTYGTTYYVKVVATDTDGAAAAGTQGSAMMVQVTSPDIAVRAIVADHILGSSITADKLASALVLASILKTADSGQRVEISADGIALFASDGSQLVSIPTVGDPYFRASITALGLDVLGKFTLRGSDNIIEAGATVTMRDKVADPASAPTIAMEWDHLTLGDTGEKHGLHYDSSGFGSVATFFSSTSRSGIWYAQEFTASSGALAREVALPSDTVGVHGVVRLSTKVYVLVERNAIVASRFYLRRYSQSALAYEAETEVTTYVTGSDLPGLCVWDGSNVGVVTVSGGDVVVHPFNSSLSHGSVTSIGEGSFTAQARVRGAVKVTESSVDYWFVSIQTTPTLQAKVRAYKVSDTLEQTDRSFYPESFSAQGIAHNGTVFYTVGAGSGSLTKHSNWVPPTGSLYVRYAYKPSGDATTTAKSPVGIASPRARAFARVTVPDIPSSLLHAFVYAGVSTSEPTLYEQFSGTAVTGRLPVPVTTSGNTAPTASTLAAGTAATFESEDGSPLLRADGYSRVKVKNGGGDTLTTATETTLTLVTQDADTDDYWDGSSSYVTVPFTGQYEVVAQASFAANGTGKRYLKLQVDAGGGFADYAPSGDGFAAATPVAGDRQTVLIATLVTLNAGDKVRMRGFQNSGGNLGCTNRITLMFQGPS